MIALTTLFVFFLALVLECARRRHEHWKYFVRRNIPGPPAHFLWGHYHLLRSNHRYWYAKWAEQYGDTYGVFWGRVPVLVTSDLELQQRVMVKEFSNFVNRAPLFPVERLHPLNRGMLVHEEGARWKNLRSVVTPAFSALHMRAVTSVIYDSVKAFGRNIAKQQGRQFDIYPLLRRLTIDSISRTAFGIDVDTQTDASVKIPLIDAAQEFFECTFSTSFDLLMNSFESFGMFFGGILTYLHKHGLIDHASDKLNREAKRIIDHRKRVPPRDDIMQTLLNSNSVSLDDSALSALGGVDDTVVNPTRKRNTVKLSDEDVLGNSVVMILAGYETTSTALAYTFHLLAKHPDIQARLRQELGDAINEDGTSEALYTAVMNHKYLDACVRESMRLYPPVTGFTTRMATEAIDHKGFKIEAGLSIKFPTHVIHNDPANFDNPLAYNPDRFDEKISHPLAYQPFGDGPRNCVGMRLALLSIKITVCHIVRNFELSTSEGIEIISKALVSQPKKVLLTAKAIKA